MSDGLCLKFQFDTYEQEIERFGGPCGMANSEAIFAADSRCAGAILRHLRTKLWPHDRTTHGVEHRHLAAGARTLRQGTVNWYSNKATPGGQEIGSEYRKRKEMLRAAAGNSQEFLAKYESGFKLAAILEERREAVFAATQELRELANTGQLGQPLDDLFSSFVHLHVNRIGGADALPEQTILSLLLRTQESLAKAPVARPGPHQAV